MQSLAIKEMIDLIQKGRSFEARAEDGSIEVKINRYVPYICTAIHEGGNLRSDLKPKIALDDYARWYEEDQYTADFIASLPITIVGCDSRFEYDLNRRPEECIYEEAWGNKVWKKKLTPKERKVSLAKHAGYYELLHALVSKLEDQYDGCVVYDMHSYNYKRWDRAVPVFNVGVERIDRDKFGDVLDNWEQELSSIQLTGIPTRTGINDVFYGRGYNLEYVTTNFKKTLVLATEVSKVFCDEETGEPYPKVIKEIQHKMKQAILNNALFFTSKHTSSNYAGANLMLGRKMDPQLLKVDRGLHKLLKNFELLAFVNPTNTAQEQKRFERNRFTELPKFKYAPIHVHPFELKQQLASLPVSSIEDVSIRHMYESVVNAYSDKVDMLGSLNSKNFLYNSLRYFGRPSQRDLKNAYYLLHLPEIPGEPKRSPQVSSDEAIGFFSDSLKSYGFQAKVEKSSRVISQAMVINSKKRVLVRPDARFYRKEIKGLVEHEIGVHMLTTHNSGLQQLKVFNIGLPVNTKTQEGLAILAEYLSGNITLMRLKKLALRVILTDMMCNGADFKECFQFLVTNQRMPYSDAFTMVTRIFRGGGFTKDYLYLSGFVKILELWNSQRSLEPLLVGKTSLEFYDTIDELIDRDMVVKPEKITNSFVNPNPSHSSELYDYIISGLK